MVEPDHLDLSITQQCKLLSISRSLFYYAPKGETAPQLDASENLLCGARSPWRTAFCARYRGGFGLIGWFSVHAGVRRAHFG